MSRYVQLATMCWAQSLTTGDVGDSDACSLPGTLALCRADTGGLWRLACLYRTRSATSSRCVEGATVPGHTCVFHWHNITIEVSLSLVSAILMWYRHVYCQYFRKPVSLAVSPIHFTWKLRYWSAILFTNYQELGRAVQASGRHLNISQITGSISEHSKAIHCAKYRFTSQRCSREIVFVRRQSFLSSSF